MSSVIHQPHDKFLKLSLGELYVAQEFFAEHLPVSVLEKIDLTTLRLENHSFIDENYKASEADIVYSTRADEGMTYLFILSEHQSRVDRWIAFRLWSYQIRLMEAHRKQHPAQPLPLIYPLVVYTGQETWNAPLDIFSLFGAEAATAREWLCRPFQLLDIKQIPDDAMRRRQWSGLVEFALKYQYIRDFKQFLKTLLPWVHELEQSGSRGFSLGKNVLKYVMDGAEAQDIDLFVESVREHLSLALRGEVMTLAQQFEQRGELRGELAVITRQLKHRFVHIPDFYLSRLHQAGTEALRQWSEKILEAKTIEDVFE